MKKTNIIYWILTGLLAALMLFSSIPNIISNAQSVDLITKHLGYPAYFIPFVGVAKFLGVIAILVPGFPRLKEWAYAGFMFDLIAAIYSSISVGDTFAAWAPMLIGPALIAGSYIFYHKKLKAASTGIAK
jgi:uncharacterized membrane protein YphA (DoxX/SURF4 family)